MPFGQKSGDEPHELSVTGLVTLFAFPLCLRLLFGKFKTSFQKLTLAVGLVGKGVGSKLLTYVLQVGAAGN